MELSRLPARIALSDTNDYEPVSSRPRNSMHHRRISLAMAQEGAFVPSSRVRDPVVIAAALLHDTMEDTKTTAPELRRLFGPKVAGVVAEVRDNKRLPKERRKELQIAHTASLSKSAKQVKLADKICNLRDILASPPKDWSIEQKREYFEWAKKVIDQGRGTNPKLERRFDQLFRQRP
jgi:guanosine-3',5'-bis(diphosphate) 3'-pyrophosphohydrolase